ncbi:hypothetical protein CN071_31905 [Sinorhizobium meliloti]|uniref:hypothetical protein n=2 Tax=Rhizobium meliloti TaxID=382 RepID=UPI000FDB5BB0|nr:hypothetical protein [Sinorhizobium meliloti]RVE99180.1 hypothetical protein CN234_34460 [Sinorhizobium meliloti]RVH43496.1 hypothetical protein CN213_36105 [Sinorhizobium meliloti]RVI43369.1 hypothetical protein CN195_28735 [Sinorhizobium meliloti]RVL91730.1 hypothetical protein CN142_36820 [Sinorhizobium meliloti]RVM22327.1 hypothetical protein CN130_33430 [Sinorhizobium meliloti]
MPMWPTYSARIGSGNLPHATIPDEVLPFIRDSEHPSLFSFGISGCATILVDNLVVHLCGWLVNARLDGIKTMSRFNFGLSDPDGRPSRRRSCNHRVLMAKVMITQIARGLVQHAVSSGYHPMRKTSLL